ncbi:MAG: caspase family protein [Desulfobacterales bacterium]|nr:caspase family protein [Desulfobacterales bacterium]
MAICRKFLVVSVFLILNLTYSYASDRGIIVQANKERVALVIGNSKYKNSPLTNPENDATDIAKELELCGFDVEYLINASQMKMEAAIRRFGVRLGNKCIGLFFFAGHGIQLNGRNYLIPVDAEIQREVDIKYKAVDVGLVLDEMHNANNGLNIVILDACRNNPFARSFRSTVNGLARIDAPTGTFIAYATEPGSVASDGDGRNSPFTKNLLIQIKEQGLPIEQVMKKVRREVMKETKNSQIPWDASSLTGDFYFYPLTLDSSNNIDFNKTILKPIAIDNFEKEILPDDGSEIWNLPEILVPTEAPSSKTVIKLANAVGDTPADACAKALTIVVRDFFHGKPTDEKYKRSVYRIYCNVVKRMPNGNIIVELSIEFYIKEGS